MFGRAKKDALDRAVAQTALPASRIDILDEPVLHEEEIPATASHFGGRPYFAEGESWPLWGDRKRPYDFVCQIHLRDCPVRPALAFDLFTVFLCWAAVEEGDVEGACVVRTYAQVEDAKAAVVWRLAPLDEDDYRIQCRAVRTEETPTYPWRFDADPAVMAASSAFRDPEGAYRASLRRLGLRDPYFGRIGGHPYWVHDDTLIEDGDRAATFLGQIAVEPEAGGVIGDAAPIFLAVSAEDPMEVLADPFQSF